MRIEVSGRQHELVLRCAAHMHAVVSRESRHQKLLARGVTDPQSSRQLNPPVARAIMTALGRGLITKFTRRARETLISYLTLLPVRLQRLVRRHHSGYQNFHHGLETFRSLDGFDGCASGLIVGRDLKIASNSLSNSSKR